jgi:hypothetical protein
VLLVGADEPCRPLLLVDELLAPELALFALEFELELELTVPAPLLVVELRTADVACADPGRVAATPAAATTLARPAAAVIVRSRARLRSLAAICCARFAARGGTGSGDICCLPLGSDVYRLASLLLKAFCGRCRSAESLRHPRVLWTTCARRGGK